MGLRSSAAQPLRQAVRGRPGVFEVAPLTRARRGVLRQCWWRSGISASFRR